MHTKSINSSHLSDLNEIMDHYRRQHQLVLPQLFMVTLFKLLVTRTSDQKPDQRMSNRKLTE